MQSHFRISTIILILYISYYILLISNWKCPIKIFEINKKFLKII
jgi:hypothetical protein